MVQGVLFMTRAQIWSVAAAVLDTPEVVNKNLHLRNSIMYCKCHTLQQMYKKEKLGC